MKGKKTRVNVNVRVNLTFDNYYYTKNCCWPIMYNMPVCLHALYIIISSIIILIYVLLPLVI